MTTLRDTADLIANITNQYIVRPLTLFNTKGISGFIFDVLDDESISLDSDITDHYVEDNYSIQDHISLRPVQFTLKGYVAELNDIFPKNNSVYPVIVSRLVDIAEFLPRFAAQAEQVYNKKLSNSERVQTAFSLASNTYSFVRQFTTDQNNQQKAYNFFHALWVSRILCTVETPWGIFTDMAIQNVRVNQEGRTNLISDFSLTFKQIRTTSTVITSDNKQSDNPEGSGTYSTNKKVAEGRMGNNTRTVFHGPVVGYRNVNDVLGEPFTRLPPSLPPATEIPPPIPVPGGISGGIPGGIPIPIPPLLIPAGLL